MVEIGDIRELLDRLDLLVVAGIPAYNEEKTIARVVLGAQKHAHIVVVCDDGSTDLTGEIAERLGAVVVRHERNAGYGAAIHSLFERAWALKADVLVTLDADGQHDPDEIPRLVKPIEDGVAEVVLGSRFMDKNGTTDMPTYRQFGVKVITTLANGSGKNGVSDAQSGFRAYSKRAMEHLASISENGMSASIELLRAVQKSGLKICEVPISCKYGDSGGVETSTKHPVAHGIDLIMSLVRLVVEDRPITFLGIPGIVSLALGTVFGIWMMNVYAIEHRIITNLALASIAFILLGFFMISTAITLYAITRISKYQKN
ncbi:MAG: glycosyltransferase family 2 protein [Candidatus Bathyarchaeia archaeon]